jgi:hypothetical protein
MTVHEHLHELIRCMGNTRDYRRYRRLSEKISGMPELKEKIAQYKKAQYRLLSESGNLLEDEELLAGQFRDLLENPIVIKYLDAENAVLCMIRKSCLAISGSLVRDLPTWE